MALDKIVIREITDEPLNTSVETIRSAFDTVAREFALTRENCPSHPAFVTEEQLSQLRSKGVRFFGLFLKDKQAGFVAVEKADNIIFYLEKLAILHEYRHHGYGKELVEFVIEYVKKQGAKVLSLGMIDEHTVLKNWYKGLGFREMAVKKFEHLPFTVRFMDYNI